MTGKIGVGRIAAGAAVLALCLGGACGAAAGGGYVVDQSRPSADDTNPGSEDKPFKTIQRGADAAQAGDTVCVMEGNYAERVAIKTSGAEGKPVVFQAVPPRSVQMLGFDVGGHSHLRLEGFRITSRKKSEKVWGVAIGKTSRNVEVTDCTLEDIYGGVSGQGTGVHVAYCRLYQTQQGLNVNGEKWLIENNDLERQFMHAGGDCDYSRMWGKGHVVRFNHYHGTFRKEVGQAHLDCVQTYNLKKDDPATCLQDLLFEYNVCSSFSQGFMVSTSTPGAMARMTFRHNIFWMGQGWDGGATGLSLSPVSNAELTNNTFAWIVWYGVRNTQGAGSVMNNNLFYRMAVPYTKGPDFAGKKNLVFDCKESPKSAGEGEVVAGDPRLTDPNAGNVRLAKGSAAIGAGTDGAAVGALEYPNVYYVDPRHPGASDEGFGYAGWPYKTAAKALAVAQSGETVVLRGGVYRETLKPASDGVTIRAMKGEKVLVSGADLVEGWKRTDKGWVAPLAAAPRRPLCDGQPWTEFSYDAAAKTITVKAGGDPRLHVFETVVRTVATDLAGRKDVKVEGIEAVNTAP